MQCDEFRVAVSQFFIGLIKKCFILSVRYILRGIIQFYFFFEFFTKCPHLFSLIANTKEGGGLLVATTEGCSRRCRDCGINPEITTHTKTQEGQTSNGSHTHVPVEPAA